MRRRCVRIISSWSVTSRRSLPKALGLEVASSAQFCSRQYSVHEGSVGWLLNCTANSIVDNRG